MSSELFESVPNFSEGRDVELIDAIADAASSAHVLDVHPDPDHHRAVVSIAGAREHLVRALARSIREANGGMRGVMALAFELPGGRLQLSMNLFRIDETTPQAVVDELQRRGLHVGGQEIVGLCPAAAANEAAAGRLLEAR